MVFAGVIAFKKRKYFRFLKIDSFADLKKSALPKQNNRSRRCRVICTVFAYENEKLLSLKCTTKY